MAEGMLFRLAGTVLEGLAKLAGEELGLAWAWGFKEEINKLSQTASAIQAVLRDAEKQHNNNNHRLTHWLEELKDVLYDVEDLLGDISTDALRRKIMAGNGMVKEVRLFFSKKNKLAYRLNMGQRVEAIRKRLDAIAADRANFPPSDRPVEPPIEIRERDQTYSFVREEEIIGRDDDKKKIVELLLQSNPAENVSVVPIVGIGGLGKTTLAKMVLKDQNIREHFPLNMWVCVSEKFELKVIVEKIIEAATGRKPEKDLQMETLQNLLQGNINGKKYLLVLDDVWNANPEMWRNLRNLLLGGARGSWIVVTTRLGLVADITGTVSPHELQGLSQSQSWLLLKQMAFKEESQESNDSRLEAFGMEIVEKCKGVPLALRVIGRLLFKRAEAEWLRVKNNIHGVIIDEENGIMPILRLSYYHLPPHLRQCFAYCSLIPKNRQLRAKFLIRFWMAQGFIQPLSGDEDLEDAGREYFKDLLWRSFFQVVKTYEDGEVEVTMHDLMHDLACSVAGAEYCIATLKAENVNERTRHVSFEDRLASDWEMRKTMLKATRVRSFFYRRDCGLNKSTWSAIMSNFKYLRMLDLGYSKIERLPRSIGNLKHLKALLLKGNTSITTLPSSLSNLQNLQILDLDCCYKLENFPRGTSKLVSLKHLQINFCQKLAYMPRGLGQLTCLQTLSKFVVGKTGGRVGQLSELNGLNNLKGELRISSLQNVIPKLGSTYLKEKLNLKSLHLSWSREEDNMINVKDEMAFECLQPHPNLEKLKLVGYPGSQISSWLSSITNLTELSLRFCANCEHLPPLHQLSSLKVLRLLYLEALKNVSEIEMQKELSSAKSTTIFLPSLKELLIEHCPSLNGWWRDDVGEASNAQLPCFPCLADLHIKDCPNLRSIPLFPSVQKLTLMRIRWKPLIRQTVKLNRTTSEAPSSSSSSSSIFPPFSKLETLQLEEINDLDSLPGEFLQNLTSLQDLSIERCTNMTSMPEGMQRLTSLTRLKIHACPHLLERCQTNICVDWPNIAHIETILIS